MKTSFRSISLAVLCSWFGITRQAYYQHRKQVEQYAIQEHIVLDLVLDMRSKHKKMGGKKLYSELKSEFDSHNIKIGRDCFFDLLRSNKLLIKARKRHHITTNSKHWMRKYPNLIKEVIPMRPNHIWVSDITYWKSQENNFYISFITDAYSKMIVGANVAETMEALESVKALQMALKGISRDTEGIIHHSDRGSQYCSAAYVNILKKRGIDISMTEKGDPLENAIAERINGIIKGEYLFDYEIKSLAEAKSVLASVVTLYNEERPHLSLNNMKPAAVYHNKTDREVKRLWKNYYKKRPETEKEA